jgi:YjbE family integral membrane protein
MWRELRAGQLQCAGADDDSPGKTCSVKTLRQAMTAIVVADVSMSLDNVLAVAGAAHDHIGILIFGLTLSIALMAVASNYIAKLLERHHWIAYIGLLIVAYVATDMIFRGIMEVSAAAVG